MRAPAHGTGLLPRRLSRRRFATESIGFAALASAPFLLSEPLRGAAMKKFRAAVIGHSGHGDYGHSVEMIFSNRTNVEVVALADPNAGARARVAAKIGARRHYADYQKMLTEERPDLVCVAPRWTDQHHAMALAALRAGAHAFMEKPITRTLAEADELLSVANKTNLKIAVAHQIRLAPNVVFLKQRIDAGFIGELLEIRAQGKQDHRAGGEDLVVLGVHLFDLMRLFAGNPEWCIARILQNGQGIALKDARAATEDIGLVAGNEISRNLHSTKESTPRLPVADKTSRQRGHGEWN
jgi:predicted dehydrogenase